MKTKALYLTIFYLIICGCSLIAQDKKGKNPSPRPGNNGVPKNETTSNPAIPVSVQKDQSIISGGQPIKKTPVDTSLRAKQNAELQMKMKIKDEQDRKAYETYQQQKRAQKEAQEREYDRQLQLSKEYEKQRIIQKEMSEKKRLELQSKTDTTNRKR